MTTMPGRAAIYARISSDSEGTRAGVDRQLADCHIMAESLGWGVAQEYVDNDISAYSGKRRPEYQRMLADLDDGLVDAIVVYNIDRLTRRPAELEHSYEAVTAAEVSQVRFVTGDTDISTVDGLMMARILGGVRREGVSEHRAQSLTQDGTGRSRRTTPRRTSSPVRIRRRQDHRAP